MNHVTITIAAALLVFTMGCSPQQSHSASSDTGPANGLGQASREPTHYSVDPAEIGDHTSGEEVLAQTGYNAGNGTILKYTESGNTKTWLRSFSREIYVNNYNDSTKQFLYKNPGSLEIVCPFPNKSKLFSSEMFVQTGPESKHRECWLKVTEAGGKQGWVFIGPGNPYSEDNWAIAGTTAADGKKFTLRKYTYSFSISRGAGAYDSPSRKARILWRTERTDNNPQINLQAIFVSAESYQGKEFVEHWVKAKDSYGRIGWFPGDVLDVERGGPKYLSPENQVESAFDPE